MNMSKSKNSKQYLDSFGNDTASISQSINELWTQVLEGIQGQDSNDTTLQRLREMHHAMFMLEYALSKFHHNITLVIWYYERLLINVTIESDILIKQAMIIQITMKIKKITMKTKKIILIEQVQMS